MWRFLSICFLSIALIGCNGPIGAGIGLGRRPIPDYIAPITFTSDDKAKLESLITDDSLRSKLLALHADYVGMLVERRTECEQAIDINGRQLTTLNGFSHAETVSALRAMLLAHYWPKDDAIITTLDTRDFTAH